MPNQPPQPTILVKKSDGTSVRMSMDEFQAYRAGIAAKQTAPDDKKRETGNKKLETVRYVFKKAEAVPAPSEAPQNVRFVFKKTKPTQIPPAGVGQVTRSSKQLNNIVVQWKDTDTEIGERMMREEITKLRNYEIADKKSVGIEELKNSRIGETNTADGRVSEIMKNISARIDAEAEGRLRSLLLSRVKGIRTNDQVREYLARPVASGGLGFSDTVTVEVMEAVRKVLPEKRVSRREITKLRNYEIADIKNDADSKDIRDSTMESVPIRKTAQDTIQEFGNLGIDEQHASHLREQKQIMHDVVPGTTEKRSMGPVDELRAMTLIDFRRLGKAPAECAERLEAKFEGLKMESYVLYLGAKEAWGTSPLHRQYQGVVVEALRSGKSVADFLRSGKEMTMEEFTAIVSLNKSVI